MAVNHYFQSGSNINNRNEQNLIDSMVQEVIQIKGFDVYYIPRQSENFDALFGEDASSYFDHYHTIEMYLENVNGFGGDPSLLSKFGIELRSSATFAVSRTRWEQVVREDPRLQLANRPAEGDILYFPMTKSFFEIRKVENDDPFYQLGKLYLYKLDCELYQYSHEVFFTGDADVDAINERTTDELQNLALDELEHALLTEEGDYILRDDFILKDIEPLSDNEELLKKATTLVDWQQRNPFAEITNPFNFV